MKLRPHHLFCVQGYQGKGYDERFCETMGRISRAISDDPNTPIVVTDGPDDVCAACPYLMDGRCTWERAGEAIVREHDGALLAAFGLRDGDVTTVLEMVEKLATSSAAYEVVRRHCKTCPWVEDCLFAARIGLSVGPERPLA